MKGFQPPPHKGLLSCRGGGWAPRKPVIHWGRSDFYGCVYTVHLVLGVTWGRVHEPTKQSREFCCQWPPSHRADRDRA